MRIQNNTTMRRIVVMVVVLIALGAGAQDAQYNRNLGLLQGEWILDLEESISNLEEESRNYYMGLSQERQQEIATAFEGKQVMFDSNGMYKIQSSGINVTGSWELLADGQTISIYIDEIEQVLEHVIETVTDTQLVIQLHQGSGEQQLFSKWYLNKASN